MIVLEQQTWVTLLGFAGFGLALLTYLATMRRDLKANIAKVDSKIDGVHADLKTDIAKSDARLTVLESRLYDIALRLPTASTQAQSSTS